MYIFGYPAGFKIRRKADAERFLTISKGEFHWSDGETDFWMKDGKVIYRPVSMRGSIFNPCFDDGGGYVDLIWKQRKHINATLL